MLSAKDIDVEERVNDLYSICHVGTAVCIATYWLLGAGKKKSKFMVFLADEVHPGTSWNTMMPVVTSHMQLYATILNSFEFQTLLNQEASTSYCYAALFGPFSNFRRRNIRLILHVHVLRLCLLFWHDVKWLFCCRGKRVFLDRCCIHQNDEDLKQQGIEHLDVFLQLSDKMLVPRIVCSTVDAYIP